MKRVCLLIVDPQNDFHPGGALGVAGADLDAIRISRMMQAHSDVFSHIVVTMDSHHPPHIAHGGFWVNGKGEHPKPFTMISNQDVVKGAWKTADPKMAEWGKEYTSKLEKNGRFKLCIWPEHCLMGTPGHNVYPCISDELQNWSRKNLKAVTYVLKGQNLLTEMYSCMQADVPLPDDPSTQWNKALMDEFLAYDKLLVCGQALSHCVNFSLRDIAANWPKDRLKDLILLRDGASSVGGFEESGNTFVRDMEQLGVTVSNTTDLELHVN